MEVNKLTNYTDSLEYQVNTLSEQVNIQDTEQFYYRDFDSKDAPNSGRKMDTSMVNILYQIELRTGENIHINTAYRTRSRNSNVGGAEKSRHMRGEAVDIRCKDESLRYDLIKTAMDLGIERIGIDRRFIHLDLGKGKRVWFY